MKTSEILNLTEKEKYEINEEFVNACWDGNLEKVKEILKGYCNPNFKLGSSIGYASQFGHLEIVKLLLERGADPSIDNNYAIRNAYYKNNKEIVRLLLQDERVRNSLSEEQIKRYEKL